MSRRDFGTVRQLKSGRWQARYLIPAGRYMTAPTTFATKAQATTFLSEIRTDMHRGTWLDPTRGTETSLAEYATTWLAQRTVKGRPLAPRTVDTYRHSLTAWILPALGPRPLAEIGPAEVRHWHQYVLAHTGPTATRQAYAVLRAIFNTAVADDLITRNPCRIRGAGQPTSPERPLIHLEDVIALTLAMPEHLRTLTLTAFWAHARLGELLALRVGDVDIEAGTLRIERQVVEVDGEGPRVTIPKVGSVRTVHLPQPVLLALQEHLHAVAESRPESRLFTRPGGEELRAHHIHAPWETARRRVGKPDLHFHDLRHAGLTLSAQSGATLAEVMRRAGHVSSQAAMRYQHAADERDAEIARLMSARSTADEPDAP